MMAKHAPVHLMKPPPPRLPLHLLPELIVTSCGERFHEKRNCSALRAATGRDTYDLCWSCYDECRGAWRQRSLLLDHRGTLHVNRGCSYERWNDGRPGRLLRPCRVCVREGLELTF